MNEWLSKYWLQLVCGAVLTFGVVLIITALISNSNAEADNEPANGNPSASPLPSISPTAMPEEEGDGTRVDDESEFDQSDKACESQLTPEELATFSSLILDYEGVFQMPPSPERTYNLSLITTQAYQTSHASTESVEAADAVVTLLRDKTTVSCAVNADGSRLAAAHVTIETGFINEAGDKEVVYPELTLPLIHYSTWVLDQGQWKVSEER